VGRKRSYCDSCEFVQPEPRLVQIAQPVKKFGFSKISNEEISDVKLQFCSMKKEKISNEDSQHKMCIQTLTEKENVPDLNEDLVHKFKECEYWRCEYFKALQQVQYLAKQLESQKFILNQSAKKCGRGGVRAGAGRPAKPYSQVKSKESRFQQISKMILHLGGSEQDAKQMFKDFLQSNEAKKFL